MLDIVARYYGMQYQGKMMIQTQGNDKKPQFGPNLGPLGPIWATKCFFKILAFSVTRYHGQLSSFTILQKTSDPIFIKFSDGWTDRLMDRGTDRLTRVISWYVVQPKLSVQNLNNACMIARKIRNCFMNSSTSTSETSKDIFLYVFISSFSSFGLCIYLYSRKLISKRKDLLEFIKRKAKAHQRNISRERSLDFDQWKRFSENYAPIRACIWLVYKIAANNCCSQLFVEFIQI